MLKKSSVVITFHLYLITLYICLKVKIRGYKSWTNCDFKLK